MPDQKQYNKKWWQKNKEKVKQYQKAWREKNKDSILRWRQKNRDKAKEWKRLWYQKHKEQSRKYERRWHSKNPNYNKEYANKNKNHRTLSRIVKNLNTGITEDMLLDLLKKQEFTCPYSGRHLILGVNTALDHIHPRAKGGDNSTISPL